MPRRPKPPDRRPYGGWSLDYVPGRASPWRVRPPRSVDPKRRASYHATKAAAEAFIAAECSRLTRRPAGDDLTLGEYFDWWRATTSVPRRWALTTAQAYAAHCRRAGPLLDCPLSELRTVAFQARVNELLTAGLREYRTEPYRRPLTADSVLGTVRTWHAALEDAVKRYGLLASNPAADLLLPDPDREEADAWTSEDVRAILDALPGHRLEALLTLLLGGGFRIGEVLAHRWSDVDWQRSRIFTRATGTHNGVQEATKTRRRRWVPLPPEVMAVLRRYRASQGWLAEFVSEHAPGKRWGYTAVLRALRALCKEIGVNPYGTHAGRHHAASYWQERGMPLAALARVLGNSPGTLSKRYLHASSESMDRAAEIMSELFRADPDVETDQRGAGRGAGREAASE